MSLRVGFVGYRDFTLCDPLQFFDFTTNLEKVRKFLKRLSAHSTFKESNLVI